MKQMEAPKCRLCEKNHWAREGCYGMLLHGGAAGGDMVKDTQRVALIARPGVQAEAGAQTGSTPAAAASRPGPKTHKSGRQPEPAKAPAEQATGEKPAGGTAKPRKRKLAPKRKLSKKPTKTKAVA